MGSGQSAESESGPLLPCRPRTGINYALAVVYLLIAILLIVMAFLLPGLSSTNVIAIALVGGVQFVLALVHIFSIASLTRPAQPEAYLSLPEYAAITSSAVPAVVVSPPPPGEAAAAPEAAAAAAAAPTKSATYTGGSATEVLTHVHGGRSCSRCHRPK